MTNLALMADTALLVLMAYLAGCVLGYAARRILHAGSGTRRVTAPVAPAAPLKPVRSAAARLAATVDEPLPTPVPRPRVPDPRPLLLEGPRGGKADNLRQIKGIGPKIESSLHDLGIFHLDQIAGWSPANIGWIDGKLAFKGRITRERWVEQARALTNTKIVA